MALSTIDWPVGTADKRATAFAKPPDPWENETPFLYKYRIAGATSDNFHTGIDLHLDPAKTSALSINEPVFAVGNGPIISSKLGRGKSWGWIIIQELVDYPGLYARYAHVQHVAYPPPLVGDFVHTGDKIALVGTADGYYSKGGAHLHFDIAFTDILVRDPSDWPGLDKARIVANYLDPQAFILIHKQDTSPMPIPSGHIATMQATDTLNIRSQPEAAAPISGTLKKGSVIQIMDYDPTLVYQRLGDGRGYVATAYLWLKVKRIVNTTARLNVRTGWGLTFPVHSKLEPDEIVWVWSGSEHDDWIKLVDRAGWVKAYYLTNPDDTQPIPPVTVENIIDMSIYQKITNATALLAGISATICRAGVGTWVDPTYATNKALLDSKLWGAYWVGNHDIDPVEQADKCIETVRATQRPGEFIIIALDLETVTPGSGGSMTLTQAEAFAARIRAVTGVRCVIYTRKGYLPTTASTLSLSPLWVANQNTPPDLPGQWRTWALQQYGQKMIDGMGGSTDHNRFLGTPASLAEWWTINGAPYVNTSPVPSPVNAATRYVIANPYVNIREAADVMSADIGDLTWGALIKVDLNSQVNHFVKLLDRVGWVSTDWISDKPPFVAPAPAPVPTPAPTLRKTSLVGFHSWGNGGWAVPQWVAEVKAGGGHVAGVTVFRQGWDKEMTASNIKASDPATLVVERYSPGGSTDALRLVDNAGIKWSWNDNDLRHVGQVALELYLAAFPVDRAADFIQIINEPVVVNALGTVSFWQGVLDTADKHPGLKIAVLNTPKTWPALPGEQRLDDRADNTFWTRPETIALIRRMIQRGDVLCVHEYILPDPGGSPTDGAMGRILKGIAALPADCRAVKVMITEWYTYCGSEMSTVDYMAGVKAAEKMLRAGKANILAVMAWVVGDYHESGHASDITKHGPALLLYIKTERF